MAKRSEVFGVIDGERDYQDKWDALRRAKGLPTRDEYATAESWILWTQEYLRKACTAATDDVDKTAALHEMRKVAALAVACMEHLGAPERR